MPNARLSVVINNYNYGRFLRDAIESALGQTYRPADVVVVDDGSTDDSSAVMEEYGDAIVAVRKDNGGQASAFNAGVAAATGDWVAFLDSDDYWHPRKLEQVAKTIETDPDAALIYHRIQPVDAAAKPCGPAMPSQLRSGNIGKLAASAGGWWPYPPTSALVFSRRYLDQVMDVPAEPFRICADSYLALLAPYFGRVRGVADVLASYRLHGGNYWNDAARLSGKRDAMLGHRMRYEIQVDATNRTLAISGSDVRVSLADHYPYQRVRWLLGESVERASLARLALRFPGKSLVGRCGDVARLVRRPSPLV